jgi:quercetin dioxygenase-like cupin family protein
MASSQARDDDEGLSGTAFRIRRWAAAPGAHDREQVDVSLGTRPVPVASSVATGEALVSNGLLGADIIRLAAGTGFTPHTHEGDHLLIVIGGQGTLAYRGCVYPTRAGDIYLVEGKAPHAVGAITDHVIIAVGAPHTPIDAPDRMSPLAYEAIASDLQDLHCLICDVHAQYPHRLHDHGCGHCPCEACHSAPGPR